MKSANLFRGNDKSSKALSGDNKSKTTTKLKKTYTENFKKKAVKLASEIGVTKAAGELEVSTSSIYSWQKSLAELPAPIQDENGNLTFELEGRTYSLNVNSEEDRESVKAEVNANSLAKYDWFKEKTGEKHWVLYNTEMYGIDFYDKNSLYYRKDSDLAPVVPINATSCYFMFYHCVTLAQLNLSNFNTSNIVTMYGMFDGCKNLTSLDLSNFDTSMVTKMNYMFCNCSKLTQLDLSNFNTSKVTDMYSMFSKCSKLTSLDLGNFDTSQVTNMGQMLYICSALTNLNLSNFDTSKVTDMRSMFATCKKLTTIYIPDKWKTNSVVYSGNMFNGCCSLTGFNPKKTNVKMAKPVEQGGYLILKK